MTDGQLPEPPPNQGPPDRFTRERDLAAYLTGEVTGVIVADPPFTCHRCGRIFEGALRYAATRVVVTPTHTPGDPRSCHPKGPPILDRRERRRIPR